MAEDQKPRTPSETLIACLDKFGEAEPEAALVAWVDENGDLCWSFSGEHSFCRMIGMVECVKATLMRRFLELSD